MTYIAEVNVEVVCRDANGNIVVSTNSRRKLAPVDPQRVEVTVAAGSFTALSPPTTAKFMALLVGAIPSISLKGITGDTGVVLTPATNIPGFDAFLPIVAGATYGLANGGASSATVPVLYL